MKTCAIEGCLEQAERKYCSKHSPRRSSAVHRQVCSLRRGAKKRKLDFDLKPEDIIKLVHETKVCPVFGFELKHGPSRWDSPSIDRIDNSKGYTLDNVMVMSQKANMAKGSMSKEELIMFAEWVCKNI